jgi:hypothetical protein
LPLLRTFSAPQPLPQLPQLLVHVGQHDHQRPALPQHRAQVLHRGQAVIALRSGNVAKHGGQPARHLLDAGGSSGAQGGGLRMRCGLLQFTDWTAAVTAEC